MTQNFNHYVGIVASGWRNMTVHIVVKVDTSDWDKYVKGMLKRTTDWRPTFRWARDELKKAYKAQFLTGGGVPSEGGIHGPNRSWNALDTGYASWKLAHYGGVPILVREGDLYRDLTTLKGRPTDIGRRTATFGTQLPYAQFHQTGTRFMPQRKIVFVPRFFARRMAERVGDYVAYGNTPYQKTKALFRE